MDAPPQGLHRLLTARLPAGASALLLLAGCASAGAGDDWPLRDFKSFTLRAPASISVTLGGVDSLAGRLSGAGVQLDYDYGLYADPLGARPGSEDYQSTTGLIDGLPARWVHYREPGALDRTLSCVGVHVPEVRRSSIGSIRFSALACSESAHATAQARAILATLRFAREVPH